MKIAMTEIKQQPMKMLEKIDSFLKSGRSRIGESSATMTKLYNFLFFPHSVGRSRTSQTRRSACPPRYMPWAIKKLALANRRIAWQNSFILGP